MKISDRERFERKYIPEPNSGCWLWNASLHNGYGQFHADGKKAQVASRVSYTFYKGEIPKGLIVRHTCDNRLCVNPDHLILGTPKDNANDAKQRGYKIVERRLHNSSHYRTGQ